MTKLKGLGRGLGSLIPVKINASSPKDPISNDESVFYIELGKIVPNPKQPRRDFDEESIEELARSIKKYGILQPLLVAKVERESKRGLDVEYQLIAGERRLRAAKKIGLPVVPAIIKDLDRYTEPLEKKGDDRVALEVALIENVQRKDLNPLEEARAYLALKEEFNLTLAQIGDRVGKSTEAVNNRLRLLRLPTYIQKALAENKISYTHARSLASIYDAQKQKEFFERALAGTMSTNDIERETTRLGAGPRAKDKRKKATDPRFLELEDNLGKSLAAVVSIRSQKLGDGGSLIVRFANLDELNTIAKKIIK